ncbi:hypothetical protein HUJ04_005495 [Dendroctonus ponderosae]|nr:hypothetical protein HUJ04_005495 [Dendroctonus ponderosae]
MEDGAAVCRKQIMELSLQTSNQIERNLIQTVAEPFPRFFADKSLDHLGSGFEASFLQKGHRFYHSIGQSDVGCHPQGFVHVSSLRLYPHVIPKALFISVGKGRSSEENLTSFNIIWEC